MRLPRLLSFLLIATNAHAAEVKVVPQGTGWQLLRDGQPYFVKGAGGGKNLPSIAEAGGNSVRLWGDENLGETLDTAHKLGLTVCAGIWLGQVRQGFKWNDPASLQRQSDHVRAVVEKYRNHPALLCWALGNEMEDPQGRNTDVWKAINALAAMVKEVDGHHPTMTVVAEIGGDKVPNIHSFCPALDLVGINAYGGAASVGERYRKAGGTKPYLLTEYGPNGVWEIGRDKLGAYPEPTSTAKAETYRRAYEGGVLGAPDLCLGSYAFLWGQKQEVTATWFSLFLADGSRLAGVDAISTLWTGKPPAHPCPAIESLSIEDGAPTGKPGDILHAKLGAKAADGDPLKIEWYFQQDPGEFGNGNDAQAVPPILHEVVVRGDLSGADVKLPESGGLYRLFAVVRDSHGGAATANRSIRVDGPKKVASAIKAKLPLSVYGEAADPEPFAPSGWMGNKELIKVDPACPTQPHTGQVCLKCEFRWTMPNAFAGARPWGGVVWQNPANDWGAQAGGYDLTGAKQLSFWARGEQGGEVVSFEFGIIAKAKGISDSAKGALPKVQLTKEWKRYEIPVTGVDLARIKTGFVWTVQGSGQPVVFYLDDILWE